MNFYDKIYTKEDLYRMTDMRDYGREDYICVGEVSSNLRIGNNGKLQQYIHISHNYKDDSYFGWGADHRWIWVDVPHESDILLEKENKNEL